MSKDPAFLFYPNDWIGGTMGMTFEEKGAYMELLMLQFNRGHMTAHMIGQTIGQLWDKVKDKFEQDDEGLWYNKRLDTEKIKRSKYTQSRLNNKKGTNQFTKKQIQKVGHMTKHMENVNVNVNEDINNKGGVGENNPDDLINTLKMPSSHKTQFETTFLDIEPTEYIRINHPQLYEVQCMQNKIKPMHIERFNLEYRYHPFENLNHLINAFKAFCKKMYNEEHNPTGGKTNGKRSQSIGTGSKKTYDNTGSLLAT